MKNFLGFLLILSLVNCQDDLITKEPVTGLGICHDEQEWDNSKIAEQLIGRWRWIFATCSDVSDEAYFQKFKGLIVEFLPDNTFISTYDGVLPQEGTFNVDNTDKKYFSLKISPEFDCMLGRIFFCEDEMEFSYRYAGGCANFFKLTF